MVWSSYGQDGYGAGAFGREFDSSGVPKGSEFQINTHTPSYQGFSSVAVLEDGGYVVTWQSLNQDGSGYGEAERYLGRARRIRLENAATARHCRHYLWRHRD